MKSRATPSSGFIALCYLILLFATACHQTEAAEVSSAAWQWQRAEQGLPRRSIILTVAVDPADPQRLWAGQYAAESLAVSHDGGQTWTSLPARLVNNPIFDLLAGPHPVDPAKTRLWAATRDGLLWSDDAGTSWQPVPGLPEATVFALAVDAANRLFLGLDDHGVYVQLDNQTEAWQPLGGESPLAEAAVLALTVSGDGQNLYAGTSGQGVFASQDFGQSWLGSYAGKYSSNVALNPASPQVAVAGLRDQLVRTQDGGQTWEEVSSLPLPSDEVASILWLADGGLGVGTSQGRLYRSLDGGESWVKGGLGLPPGGVLGLAANRLSGDSTQLLAATWNGLYASRDDGQSWINLAPELGDPQPRVLLGGPEGVLLGTSVGLFRWQPEQQQWSALPFEFPSGIDSLAAHPTEPEMLYAGTTSDGVFRSDDGGESWRQLPSRSFGVPALTIDPKRPDQLFLLAAWERVYESRNGGETWAARWDGLGDVLETVSLAVDPVESFVYIGTEAGLFRREGSQPWEWVVPKLSEVSVLALLSLPAENGSVLYLGTTRGVYRSLDNGLSVQGADDDSRWGSGLAGISVTALLAEAENQQKLYAGTAYQGLFQSDDGGQQWRPVGLSELSDQVIESLAWDSAGNLLVVATDSVWLGIAP